MNKYMILMDIKGPGGTARDVPNNKNPIEATSIQEILKELELPD